jgi:hypothetical protein
MEYTIYSDQEDVAMFIVSRVSVIVLLALLAAGAVSANAYAATRENVF